LLVALSRYGGLRCPSEHLALTWADVDWERQRFLVRSSKTGERWVPLFPELLPHLEAAFDRAEPGAVYVIAQHRNTNMNLRTRLIHPSHRPETLAEVVPQPARFPADGIGRVLPPARCLRLDRQFNADRAQALLADHGRRLHKGRGVRREGGAESGAARPRTGLQGQTAGNPERELVQSLAAGCENTLNHLVRPEGFEPPTYGSEDHCSIQLSYGRLAHEMGSV
jgi:hypothetical protein